MVPDFSDPFRARLSFDERGGSYEVQADLRGLTVEELQVRVQGDTLTISGATNAEGEQRPFCRTLRLPTIVRGDRAEARFENNVLSLTMPRTTAAMAAWKPAAAAATPPARVETAAGRADDRRVLIVDDDETIREFLSMSLADQGYQVVTAPNGAAALNLIREAPPKVILLDMRMPVMDGWQFAEAYRELPGPHAPIIAVTAARDAPAWCTEIGADGCLPKPFDLDEMLETVGQYAQAS